MGKPMETGRRLLVARGRGAWRPWAVIANGCGVSVWADEDVLKLMVVSDVQLFEYSKNH